MTFSFKITAHDFLQYHLYMASKSGVINKKRAIAKYFFAIAYFGMAVWLLVNGTTVLGIVFAALSILWFFLYPMLNRKSMQRFYAKYIAENYAEKLNRTTQITIEKDFIFTNDGTLESKIPVSEIEKLIEIGDCFFLRLKTANAFIIPKNQIDATAFKSAIKEISISVDDQINWQWR